MPTQEEILKALQVIKEVCTQTASCKDCPLRRPDPPGFLEPVCGVKYNITGNWEIAKTEGLWRAFK